MHFVSLIKKEMKNNRVLFKQRNRNAPESNLGEFKSIYSILKAFAFGLGLHKHPNSLNLLLLI